MNSLAGIRVPNQPIHILFGFQTNGLVCESLKLFVSALLGFEPFRDVLAGEF